MKTTTNVDRTISRTVRVYAAERGLSVQDLATACAIPTSTMYSRLSNRKRWDAVEVQLVATYLDVSVATLYEGVQLPRLDSNQEPPGLQLVGFDDFDERLAAELGGMLAA